MVATWETLGSIDPADMVEARVVLHHALQLAAAPGATLLEPRPDDGHPNLGWHEAARALVGRALPPQGGVRAALRPETLELLVLVGGRTDARLPLEEHGRDEALRWLAEALRRRGARLPAGGLALPGYEIPDHDVAHGAAFPGPDARHPELARWFADAHRLLVDVAAGETDASPVRCWPHHFDIATLVTLARDARGDATRTLGCGLSPGDESYAEPYWYVSPWPPPSHGAALPPLESGAWHTRGFTAAVLVASHAVRGPEQRRRASHFLAAARRACRALPPGDAPAS